MTHLDAGYLDASATAPLHPAARAAMLAVWDVGTGNASSVHSAGHRARRVLEDSRETLARAFGVRAGDVVFTSGGTEANNLALQGLIDAALAAPEENSGGHLVTTPIEHSSIRATAAHLARARGTEITEVPVDSRGRVDPAAVLAAVRADTTLVSIGLANAEIGTVQPVAEVAAALAEKYGRTRPLLHTDAVQVAATLPVSFGKDGWPGLGIDAVSLASHKFGGPQGVGALLLPTGAVPTPVIHGGGQEQGLRSGTENVAGIAGFAAAVRAVHDAGVGTRALALMESRDLLVERFLARVPGAVLTGDPADRLPHHASFAVPGVSGEKMLVALDVAGFAASSGSACAAGSSEPSPVLLAMGIDADLALSALRFTLPAPLEAERIERLVEVVAVEVAR